MSEQLRRPVPPRTTRPVYRWSRREGSVTTFGLRGRLVTTVVVTVLPVWFFVNAGAFGILGLALWLVAVLPVVLRDTWQRTRVLVVPPMEVDWEPPPAVDPMPDGTYVGPNHPGQPRW